MPSKSIIELKNVSKIYEMGDSKVFALDDVSIKVRQGEFLMILGASGSGKSTMMHMVGCLDLPSKGTVFLDGHDISKLSESELAAIRGETVGFVFQTFNLIQTMSVVENIALPLLFQGVSGGGRLERAGEYAKLVELEHRLYHRPTELSGGERQRVAVARALVSDPKIVIADEPTGNLDTRRGKQVMDTLKKINKQGKTVIVVTHDVDLTCYADRVIYLRDGKLVSESGRCSRPLDVNKSASGPNSTKKPAKRRVSKKVATRTKTVTVVKSGKNSRKSKK